MKARILSDGLFGGVYSDSFLLENKNNEINNELVSNWILTALLPNNLLQPIYNGTIWVEGITQSEIDAKTLLIEENEDKSDIEILQTKGTRLVTRTKERLVRRKKRGLITRAQTKSVRVLLHPIFLFLQTGDIDIANDKSIALATNANAIIQAELVWFKVECASLFMDVNNLL